MTDTPVSVLAPAKLNLYLHVLGRRADGFHRLDSLIVFAGVGDVICARPAKMLSLTLSGPFARSLSTGDDNLVLKAARLLAGAQLRGARLSLAKHLPVASGIGGGSADAAATLKVLARLWRIRHAASQNAKIAPRLGADVPVCLAGMPSFIGGIGERITPAPKLPGLWAVLANPGIPVSTPEVFSTFRKSTSPFGKTARFRRLPHDADAFARMLRERRNDLEAAALSLAPSIGQVLAALAAQPQALIARMSGSGATCFALFTAEQQARAAARTIGRAEPSWWVAAAPILNRAPTPGTR